MSIQAQALPVPGGDLIYWRQAVPIALADRWLAALMGEIHWQREELHIFGRSISVPRRVAWYGDPGNAYRYSGVVHQPLAWTPLLATIRERLQELTGADFNSALANLYRDGADSMGWHSDDEAELGSRPVIASLSLGEQRKLRFRHRAGSEPPWELWLEHGSLLLMGGKTQDNWQHALPKTRRPVGPRINLTFRRIVGA